MDRRTLKRCPNEVLKYFLDKHRDEMMRQENQRRRELKEQFRRMK